jgi:5-methylcytosine-specific restriction endonuclease McrA
MSISSAVAQWRQSRKPGRKCAVCGQPSKKKYCSNACELKQRYQNNKHRSNRSEQVRISNMQRRTKIRNLPNDYTVDDWQRALEFFGYGCAYCGDTANRIDQEHFIPAAMHGGLTRDNIVPACKSCNRLKSNKDPLEWLLTKEHGLVTYAKIVQYFDTVNV